MSTTKYMVYEIQNFNSSLTKALQRTLLWASIQFNIWKSTLQIHRYTVLPSMSSLSLLMSVGINQLKVHYCWEIMDMCYYLQHDFKISISWSENFLAHFSSFFLYTSHITLLYFLPDVLLFSHGSQCIVHIEYFIGPIQRIWLLLRGPSRIPHIHLAISYK